MIVVGCITPLRRNDGSGLNGLWWFHVPDFRASCSRIEVVNKHYLGS